MSRRGSWIISQKSGARRGPGSGKSRSEAQALHLLQGHGLGRRRSRAPRRDRRGSQSAVRRAHLETLRQTIHEDVCREGWNAGLGTFTQSYSDEALDASLLLLPLLGFLPAGDPRITATIAKIASELTEGGLIRRTKAKVDGPNEGAFLACSFWMADCLALQGRHDEAPLQFERVTALANDVGLLSEEYNVPGQAPRRQFSAGAHPSCAGQHGARSIRTRSQPRGWLSSNSRPFLQRHEAEMVDNHYDVIVIGSGPGGGPVAHRLSPRASASSCWSVANICRARGELGRQDGVRGRGLSGY